MVARLRRWKSIEAAGVKKRERERKEVRGVRRDVMLWCILMVGKEWTAMLCTGRARELRSGERKAQ